MERLCWFLVGLATVAVVGHLIWLAAAAVFKAVFGRADRAYDQDHRSRPARPYRYCPDCGADTDSRDRFCPDCDLELDGRRARALHRVNTAVREVEELGDQLDADTADKVLAQLRARRRAIRGGPAAPPTDRARARPVREQPAPADLAPPSAVELLPASEPALPAEPALAPRAPVAPDAPEPALPAGPVAPPAPPDRRGVANFLESHNILWGELVGGLLIVGCSIALVVTLRQTLEAIPYFRFLLSAAVTLGLFGAGQYTLHRWKLAGTSRGMLVISLLLTPLTLLLLGGPFSQEAGPLDVGVKLLAVLAFVGVVRVGGRDLLGTEHLPGPVDRRWLLALAVVGAAGAQLLPASLATAWPSLGCFVVAVAATVGGLSWYRPAQRDEPLA
ncbi:MAG: hypothetical protein K2V38_00635, partial [Gemmataceae bacterium]|nr:hypothetical protein [Gemmataceae bacterium]